MYQASWVAVAIFATDLMIRIGLSVRVIMRRRPVGVSLAWLAIVLIFPFAGALVYLFIGELRLGRRRAERAAQIHEPYQHWLNELRGRYRAGWEVLEPLCQPVSRNVEATVGIPALAGNELTLLKSTDDVFRALIADIDAAQRTCHLEFYIWHPGGLADEVAAALMRAATRGVACRVLVDDVGSRDFLRSDLPRRMRAAGVVLHSALRAGLFRMLFVRFDLRLHRKIVVIDGEIAYTGSMNLVDPRYFKQDAGVGQWIDAMVRLRGPGVEGLAITFLEDWELEADEGLERLREIGDVHPLEEAGDAAIQVIPSGPARDDETVPEILLTTIYSARRELVLTTPYFVPDESLVLALVAAARRGVDVTLVVPERVDSRLVRLASQAFKGDLLAAGVRVALFRGGLLHTKSITVDRCFSLFGSLNLDPRSLYLNFEITLVVYGQQFTTELRALQQAYIDNSVMMDREVWQARTFLTQLSENAARLLGPLL